MKQVFKIQNWVISIIIFFLGSTGLNAQPPTTDLTMIPPTTPLPLGAILEWHNALPISASNLINNPSSVSVGLYYMVYKLSDNSYSQPTPVMVASNNCPQNSSNLNNYVSNSNIPTGSSISFHSAAPVSSVNKLSSISVVSAQAGTYYVTYIDTKNDCYSPPSIIILLNADCCEPPILSNNEICGAGQVTLSATCSLGIANWYESSVSPTPINIGNSLTTPSLLQTQLYYVSCKNGLCESIKKAVLAIIKELPKVEILSISPTCLGTLNISNGQIIATKFFDTDTYSINEGNTFNSLIATSATTIPTDGILKKSISTKPLSIFSIRVTSANSCFKDQSITISDACPQCPERVCVLPLITKTK